MYFKLDVAVFYGVWLLGSMHHFTGFHFLNKEKSIFSCTLQHCIQSYRHFLTTNIDTFRSHSWFFFSPFKFIIQHNWLARAYSFRITVGDLIYCSMHCLLKRYFRARSPLFRIQCNRIFSETEQSTKYDNPQLNQNQNDKAILPIEALRIAVSRTRIYELIGFPLFSNRFLENINLNRPLLPVLTAISFFSSEKWQNTKFQLKFECFWIQEKTYWNIFSKPAPKMCTKNHEKTSPNQHHIWNMEFDGFVANLFKHFLRQFFHRHFCLWRIISTLTVAKHVALQFYLYN